MNQIKEPMFLPPFLQTPTDNFNKSLSEAFGVKLWANVACCPFARLIYQMYRFLFCLQMGQSQSCGTKFVPYWGKLVNIYNMWILYDTHLKQWGFFISLCDQQPALWNRSFLEDVAHLELHNMFLFFADCVCANNSRDESYYKAEFHHRWCHWPDILVWFNIVWSKKVK